MNYELGLVAITMVFGIVRLLSFTKLFDVRLIGMLEVLIPHIEKSKFFVWLDYLIFYGSLCFQAYYWLTYVTK